MNEINISKLSNWVHHVVKYEPNHIGIWMKDTAVFSHCIKFHNNMTISDYVMKRKLNKLSQLNRYFFKKDNYDVSEQKYVTYYLFISDKMKIDYDFLTEQFTQHSDSMTSLHQSIEKNSDSVLTSTIITNQTKKRVTKWQSPEALKYFMPALFVNIREGKEESVSDQKAIILAHLRSQMTLFRDGWLCEQAWKELVADKDADDLYTQKDIHKLCF